MLLVVSKDIINVLSELRHVRACIVLSFLVQAFLTIFAPLRKCLGGKWGIFFGFFIWLAYSLADWTAIFTIGSIFLITLIRSFSEYNDLQVFWFWEPFLLLYLGGPDTITAFAVKNNESWLRKLLGLTFQVGSTLYVFLVSLPDNKLWPATLLVLIAGIIKYAERIYAFYLASFDHFGDNWVRGEDLDFYLTSEEGTSTDQREERTACTDKKNGAAGLRIPAHFKNLGTSDRLRDMPKKVTVRKLPSGKNNIHQYFAFSDYKSIVKAAVYLFGTIRRPMVGSFLSRAQLWKSFANLGSQNNDGSAKEALQKIEIELSLLYEVLHTKWPLVVSKFGFLCRALDIGCIMGAFVLFSLLKKQAKLEEYDTWLTYGLLIGALALDFISLILLFVFSDWFFIAYFHEKGSKSVENFINRRRWSKTITQLNFITFVVHDHPSLGKRRANKCLSWVKKCPSMCPCLYWVAKCLPLSYPSWAKKCLSWVKKWVKKWLKKWERVKKCLSLVKKCLSLVKKWVKKWVRVKKCLSWVKKWVKKGVRVKKCLFLSSQNFREDTWRFIFKQVEGFSKISPRKEEEGAFSEGRPVSIRPNVELLTMIIDILEEENINGKVILGDPSEDRVKDPLEELEQIGQGEISLEDLFKDTAQNGTKINLWFTRSLLIFHIATELFLQDSPPTPSSPSGSNDHRATCKILSDYLFYLAMMKSNMLAPALDSWEKVFSDTYEEAKSVLKLDSIEENACTKILSGDFDQVPSRRKDLNGSVLILARDLAQALKGKRYCENGNDQYDNLCKMLSHVWVCLLAHAASNCRPNVHANQPRKGGELLTFIWLCIANCGDVKLNRIMTRIESG